MRTRIVVLVAVTSLLTALIAAPGLATTIHTAIGDRRFVDLMVHGVSLSTFLSRIGDDPWYDWTTDLCSAPLIGSTGTSFDFRQPCRRHDFGYRNLRLIDRRYGSGHWNSSSRLAVDDRFLGDMRAHCATRSAWLQPSCFTWAQVFYAAVRLAGGP